jgi:hypothetical protein
VQSVLVTQLPVLHRVEHRARLTHTSYDLTQLLLLAQALSSGEYGLPDGDTTSLKT